MLDRLRGRLTFANVVSLIALFVSLGGVGAYAANTIYSDDIVDGQVMRQDIANDAVNGAKNPSGNIDSTDPKANALTTVSIAPLAVTNARLAPNAVTGDKVAPDTLTGSNIDEGTLNISDATAAFAADTDLPPASSSPRIMKSMSFTT